jgi:hypothetical protein
MAERGRLASIGERVTQAHLDHFCPGGAGLPVVGSGPIGLSLPGADPAGYDGNSARAAGRRCGRCAEPITPRQDVRRRADGTWAHETCPR